MRLKKLLNEMSRARVCACMNEWVVVRDEREKEEKGRERFFLAISTGLKFTYQSNLFAVSYDVLHI